MYWHAALEVAIRLGPGEHTGERGPLPVESDACESAPSAEAHGCTALQSAQDKLLCTDCCTPGAQSKACSPEAGHRAAPMQPPRSALPRGPFAAVRGFARPAWERSEKKRPFWVPPAGALGLLIDGNALRPAVHQQSASSGLMMSQGVLSRAHSVTQLSPKYGASSCLSVPHTHTRK